MHDPILPLFLAGDSTHFQQAFQWIEHNPISKRIVSYLLMVHLFHRDKEIRQGARKLFKKYADVRLQEIIKTTWSGGTYPRKSLHNLISESYQIYQQQLERHPQFDPAEASLLMQLMHRDPTLPIETITLDFATYLPDSVILMAPHLKELDFRRSVAQATVGKTIEECTPRLDIDQVIAQAQKLSRLLTLNIGWTNVYFELPETILQLQSLEHLELGDYVTHIPEDFSALENLQTLSLVGNEKLTRLPAKLPASLQVIDVQHTLLLAAHQDYLRGYQQRNPRVQLNGFFFTPPAV